MKTKAAKTDLLKEAYALTNNVTPLKLDCGKLCSALCCKENVTGSGEYGGMQLLPGEELLLSQQAGFEIKNTPDGNILICDGKCERTLRPFMCRIFPYYAHIIESENGKTHISLMTDPRALRLCPLVSGKRGKKRTTVYFKRNIIKAVRLLLCDRDIKEEIIKTSAFCDSLYELYGKMLK